MGAALPGKQGYLILVLTRRNFIVGGLAISANAQQKAVVYRPDASAWQSVGFGAWAAQDSEISGHCEKSRPGEGFLLGREEFKDFRLTLSFWISAGGSSAIFVREPRRKWGPTGNDRPGRGPNAGYEIAINYRDTENPTGTICNVQKPKKVAGAEEQWNELEILFRGSELRITIAGQKVNRVDQLLSQPGVIGFKTPATAPEGFVVRFQDVAISPIA